jgi:diguanylate cyclase (GGDEF)-like protein
MAIKELTSTVTNSLRNFDTVFRYGGEEFVVILAETETDEALSIAERIRKKIENNHFLIKKKPEQAISYTISIGCAMHKSCISADVLISEADKALYRAKTNGRNRVEC